MDPQQDSTPLPIQTAIRFCNRCGAVWQPEWTACAFCAAAQLKPQVAASDSDAYEELVSVNASLGLYFSLLAVSIVALFIGMVSEDGLPVEAELVVEAFMSVITVGFAIRHRRAVLQSLTRVGRPLYLLLAPVLAVGTFFLASYIVHGLSRLTGEASLDYSTDYLSAGYGWGLIFMSVAIQPAIIEEIAFRGVILPALNRAMGSGEAVIVSGMMFAILHLSVPSLPHLIVIGLVLGWLRQKTGSLYACMLMHFTHNSLVLLSERYGSTFGY